MENAEEIFHFLDDFSKRKPKTIPQELNEYLAYVARTGDPVYQWPLVKSLFKEKLLNVISDFYETTPGIEIPPYPNVDQFNYDIMKNSLLERLDSFTSAPFTVQRLCELLTFPRKQYNRIDKFMRAIEKNILVVSTREPGIQRHSETENGEANEPIVNGSDNSEYHVDVEMEDTSRKESSEQWANEPQPGSSDTHISVDDVEARLKAKENTPMDSEKKPTEYESVTPPELNVTTDDSEKKPEEKSPSRSKPEVEDIEEKETDAKLETPSSTEKTDCTLVIPEIRINNAEMTERNLIEQANMEKLPEANTLSSKSETAIDTQTIDDSSSDSKYESETKLISEVLTSSEESSSSSDNTDGSCSSPKTDYIQEESTPDTETPEMSDETVTISNKVSPTKPKVSPTKPKVSPTKLKASPTTNKTSPNKPKDSPISIKTEDYTISDVQSKPKEIQEEAADQQKNKVTEEKIVIDEKAIDSESEKEKTE